MLRWAIVFLHTALTVFASEQAVRSWRTESSPILIGMLARTYENLPPELKKEDDPYQAICGILLQRNEVTLLVAAYSRSTDAITRQYLASSVLYEISDPAIVRLFRTRLAEEETKESYYVANYLAKLGDEKALEILNRHYFHYPVSSLQWAETAVLFGKFRYRPAIPNLISSLDAASLNLVGAAVDALKQLFPGTPQNLKTLAAHRDYFLKRIAEENTAHR